MRRKTVLASLIATVALVAVVAGPAPAGEFERGTEAYRGGNYQAARRHWQPLAQDGHTAAQYNIGRMFYYGRGFAKDRVEAYKWFLLASQQGVRKAQSALEAVHAELDRTQVADARRRAHDWRFGTRR